MLFLVEPNTNDFMSGPLLPCQPEADCGNPYAMQCDCYGGVTW